MSKKTLFLHILGIFAITSGLFLQYSVVQIKADATGDDCSLNASMTDLQGSVHGNQATVTNYSPNCTYQATLALYDSPQAPNSFDWINVQTLINSNTVTVNAGQTVNFSVSGAGPSCWEQADLLRGNQVWTPPFYYDAMATAVYQVNCGGSVPPTVTPTCTPAIVDTPSVTPTPDTTSSPTPGPSVTPTPGPTSTPTPGPSVTPTPGPGATPTPTSVPTIQAAALAFTGNVLFIYGLILAAATFLISGLVLRKFGK